MTFAQQLRASMAAREITVDALAAETGLSKFTIIKARRNGTKLHFDTVKKLARALDLSLDSITP